MQDVLPLQIHSKVCSEILPHCLKLWQTSGCGAWQLAIVIRKGCSWSPAPRLISCRGPLQWCVLCGACWWITGCTEMTIITHNAPREGAASLRDNISHKYAKRLLSLLHAISQTRFVSVQGCSDCILKNVLLEKIERLMNLTQNETLWCYKFCIIGNLTQGCTWLNKAHANKNVYLDEQFNIYP